MEKLSKATKYVLFANTALKNLAGIAAAAISVSFTCKAKVGFHSKLTTNTAIKADDASDDKAGIDASGDYTN